MVLKVGHELPDGEIIARYAAGQAAGIKSSEFYQRLLDLAGDLTDCRVLEVGCGRGGLLKVIAERFTCELHGVDLVDRFVEEASRRAGSRVTIAIADAQQRLPYPDGHFDVVFCMELLEHLKSPDRCLAEVRRVLKDDGRMILSVPNATGYFPFHSLGTLIPTRWLRRKLLPYEHPVNTQQPIDTMYTYREILRLVKANGFAVDAMAGYRYFRYALGFPVLRSLYTPLAPRVEALLERLGWRRFAYQLIVGCRKGR